MLVTLSGLRDSIHSFLELRRRRGLETDLDPDRDRDWDLVTALGRLLATDAPFDSPFCLRVVGALPCGEDSL